MCTEPPAVESGEDHDFDDHETSPVARIVVAEPEPPDTAHTRVVCDRGGIQIWALPDDDEETLT